MRTRSEVSQSPKIAAFTPEVVQSFRVPGFKGLSRGAFRVEGLGLGLGGCRV